jgi:hypothetical protein
MIYYTGMLYAVGGYDGASRQCLSSVECYNPLTDKWIPVKDMSCRRSGAGRIISLLHIKLKFRVRAMMFSATFNNITVISWRAVLLVQETGIPGENHQQILLHNVVLSTPHHERNSNSQL